MIRAPWVGATKGSAKHLDILEVYNNYRPLARGYKVQVKDAYCATTVSAAYIRAGIAKYTGTECGVEKYTIVAVLILMVITNIIVEVVKKLTWDKVPTNLLAFIVAMAVTLLAFFAVCRILAVPIVWYMVAAAIGLGFFVAFAAMFGWDKFRQMLEQITRLENRKGKSLSRCTLCHFSRKCGRRKYSSRNCGAADKITFSAKGIAAVFYNYYFKKTALPESPHTP